MPGTADLVDRIIADFRVTMTAIKRVSSERLLRIGVSMAQLHILYTIVRSGGMTMSRLAEELGVSLSNATGLVDRLAERGFLERVRVPEDRRVVVVRLTDEGSQLLSEADAVSDDLLRSILDGLKPAEVAGIAQAMSDLRAATATPGVPTPIDRPDRHPVSAPAPRSPSMVRATPADVTRRV